MASTGFSGEPFERRVRSLRDSWSERRHVKLFANNHDFSCQQQLLATLHGWAEDACLDIERVYGESLAAAVSPLPAESDDPCFRVTVAERFHTTFTLVERQRAGTPSWHLEVSIGFAEPGGRGIAAGPERRNGNWTRNRLESILLSLLGAYERSLGDGEDSLAVS